MRGIFNKTLFFCRNGEEQFDMNERTADKIVNFMKEYVF